MNKSFKQHGILGIIITGSLFALSLINYFIFDGKPDNPAEQLQEDIIKNVTGIDMDLSDEKREEE